MSSTPEAGSPTEPETRAETVRSDGIGGPAVEVRELVKAYDRHAKNPALQGISFDVRGGEVFGLLGPNGAGKTTTLTILLTLIRPTSGEARVCGVDVTADPDRVRRTIGWVPQGRAVDPYLSARQNLRFVAGLYHLPRRARNRLAGKGIRRTDGTTTDDRVDELLALVELEADADRIVGRFSGGMQRRLELAMGLVHRPTVLVLDEPTLGLDVSARRRIWRHIADIRQRGTTVVVTTHYLEEADALCDRIAVIDRGRLAAIGAPDDLKRRLGPGASLDDVFDAVTGRAWDHEEGS